MGGVLGRVEMGRGGGGFSPSIDTSRIYLFNWAALRIRYCVHIEFSYLNLASFVRIEVLTQG